MVYLQSQEQFVSLLVIQDGTGSRTLSFNYIIMSSKMIQRLTLTTTVLKATYLYLDITEVSFLEVGRNQNLTLSHRRYRMAFALVESGKITKLINGNKGIEVGGVNLCSIFTIWSESERNVYTMFTQ